MLIPLPARPGHGDADGNTGRRDLMVVARRILAARRALQQALGADLTHEPTLDILLTLFLAADDGPVGFRTLATQTTISLPGVERWLRALDAEGLIARIGPAARLSPAGETRVATALRGVVRSQMAERWG